MTVRRLFALTMSLLLIGILRPLQAAPDFSASTITATPESPREGDIVDYEVVVRNGAAVDADSVYLSVEWPLMGFLIDADGFDGATFDHVDRDIRLDFPLSAGQSRRFDVRVLAPRNSGGDVMTLAIHVADFHSGTEHWDRNSVTIDTRVAMTEGDSSGIVITPAGKLTFAVLGVLILLWVLLWRFAVSRSGGRGGGLFGSGVAPLLICISLGFWAIFAAMAWRDYQSLKWPITRCTVLGGRLSAHSTTNTRPGTLTRHRDDTNYVPILGLGYHVDGQQMYSSGYDTGSRLGIGGFAGAQDDLEQWNVGAQVPCWYDFDDPTDVVVLRGYGGAYLFALFPLPLFLFGVSRLRSLYRRS